MKIGKLAKAVGCSVDAIRFYEQKGIMPRPSRSVVIYLLLSLFGYVLGRNQIALEFGHCIGTTKNRN